MFEGSVYLLVGVAIGVKGYPFADSGELGPNSPSHTMTSNVLAPVVDAPTKVS